jgi:hypothetical protein
MPINQPTTANVVAEMALKLQAATGFALRCRHGPKEEKRG